MKGEYAQVSSRDVVAGNDRLLEVHNIIKASVGVEVGLNVFKENDRPIGSATAIAGSTCKNEPPAILRKRYTYPNCPWDSINGENATESWNTRRKDS